MRSIDQAPTGRPDSSIRLGIALAAAGLSSVTALSAAVANRNADFAFTQTGGIDVQQACVPPPDGQDKRQPEQPVEQQVTAVLAHSPAIGRAVSTEVAYRAIGAPKDALYRQSLSLARGTQQAVRHRKQPRPLSEHGSSKPNYHLRRDKGGNRFS